MIWLIVNILGATLTAFYVGYFLLMKRKSQEERFNPKSIDEKKILYSPSTSILIPTYNEEKTILHKLNNLAKQTFSFSEIIVIDGASTDSTVKLVEEFSRSSELNLKVIREKERAGKATSLNKGFKHCNGEIVVISDSDAVWENDALGKAIYNFKDENVGAVTGRQILLNKDQNLATKVESSYRNMYEIIRVGESVLDSTPIFHGEISCFRRKLISEIDKSSMADDSELAILVRKKGYRTIYDPSVIFYEYAPPSFKSRLIQKMRRGQGLIKLLLRERGILFNPKYGTFGKVIFPAEFFMHVISPLLLIAFLISFIYGISLVDSLTLTNPIFFLGCFFLVASLIKFGLGRYILSFLSSQFTLLVSIGYLLTGKSQHKWPKIDEIRQLWDQSEQKMI